MQKLKDESCKANAWKSPLSIARTFVKLYKESATEDRHILLTRKLCTSVSINMKYFEAVFVSL